ncbi:polysaccharide deacetylase family protein [Flavobacteriaceae bacterium]|jgi:polysaccharide deacetylase family protein (PEP-CTERM system associated)|nr:polysaccharide deacetylase family protein [Flavobacteriaceae bacterium]MDB4203668.1 polysaccharide deacetylase family protein [Flavobacteriaceae bacterium]
MNILTFDIEEWFHILDNKSTKSVKSWANYEYRLDSNMDKIFELLDRNNQKATFFCLGWVARKFPHIVRRIDDLGYEIGTHSDIHQLAYEQTRSAFKNDLNHSICSIENIIGKKVKCYRAPGFSLTKKNLWVFEELLKQGIEVDCSVFPANRSHGGLPSYNYSKPSLLNIDGFELKEFPINLFDFFNTNIIFSGGGYFRLLPYSIIKTMMKQSDYVMTYFHPRDFDPQQPIINDLSLIRKFKSYVGLNSSLGKLENLIKDFDFVDLSQADDNIDWNNVKKIKIVSK